MDNEKITGYHYTSYSNWQQIKLHGLIPYAINKPELREYFPGGFNGVWTWRDNLKDKAHLGSVIFQMGARGEFQVVKLKYTVDKKDLLYFGERRVVIYHMGTIGTYTGDVENDFMYHDRTPAHIVTRKIEPHEITLVGVYGITAMPYK